MPQNPEPLSEEGEARLHLRLEASPGTHLRVTVERLPDDLQTGETGRGEQESAGEVIIASEAVGLPVTVHIQAKENPAVWSGFHPGGWLARQGVRWQQAAAGRLARYGGPALVLFAASLFVYLLVRLIGLAGFPIFFFTDEAVQTMLAHDLVRDGFRNADKVFLPTYFKNGMYYNLSTSVYLQVLPYLVFGKSVFITRITSVLVGMLAALSVGLILRDFFRARCWWCGPLVLSAMPAWFLHSRTAFETVLFVAFYAGGLYFYLQYRLRNPNQLYPALILGALAFYSYSPGQVVVAVTAGLLIMSDLPYHWQQRHVVWRGLLLGLVLGLPYLRFRLAQPGGALDHLRHLDSYLLQPLPPGEKLVRFVREYLSGLSLGYWFVPNERDLARHLMKGYGHLLRPAYPFILLGSLVGVWKIRRPEHRLIWLAALAAPSGAALVGIGITRVLVFVIPASLWAVIGFEWAAVWVSKRFGNRGLPGSDQAGRQLQPLAAALLFIGLAGLNFGLLRDALWNGPTWYQDYGMGGMQYGARQVFGEIEDLLTLHPEWEIILSPTWANGTDVLARYFLGDPLPIRLGSISGHMDRQLPLDDQTLFITTPEEYTRVYTSQKFTAIRVEQTIPYPNNSPGFYFLRMAYVDDIDMIMAAEQAKRRSLRQTTAQLRGQTVRVSHSMLDMGEIGLLFDEDLYTFGRTWEANPAVVQISFPAPVFCKGLEITIGSIEARITAWVDQGPGLPERRFELTQKGSVDQPSLLLDFNELLNVSSLKLEVEDVHQDEPAHVHIWEIKLLGDE